MYITDENQNRSCKGQSHTLQWHLLSLALISHICCVIGHLACNTLWQQYEANHPIARYVRSYILPATYKVLLCITNFENLGGPGLPPVSLACHN